MAKGKLDVETKRSGLGKMRMLMGRNPPIGVSALGLWIETVLYILMGLCLASLIGLKLAWDEFTLGCGVGIFPGGGSSGKIG